VVVYVVMNWDELLCVCVYVCVQTSHKSADVESVYCTVQCTVQHVRIFVCQLCIGGDTSGAIRRYRRPVHPIM